MRNHHTILGGAITPKSSIYWRVSLCISGSYIPARTQHLPETSHPLALTVTFPFARFVPKQCPPRGTHVASQISATAVQVTKASRRTSSSNGSDSLLPSSFCNKSEDCHKQRTNPHRTTQRAILTRRRFDDASSRSIVGAGRLLFVDGKCWPYARERSKTCQYSCVLCCVRPLLSNERSARPSSLDTASTRGFALARNGDVCVCVCVCMNAPPH